MSDHAAEVLPDRSMHRSIVHVMVLLQRPGDGKVLTVRHRPTSWHSPGLLTVVGGRLEAEEFLDEGALRELAEEVGVHADRQQLRFCQLAHFHASDGERVIGAVFVLRNWDDSPRNAEPEVHSELVWVDPADAPSDCHPFTAEVLRNFSTGVPYLHFTDPKLVSERSSDAGGRP
jgi:8-oxo-dGTP pyrophosphatase MutT (NUDIX family)